MSRSTTLGILLLIFISGAGQGFAYLTGLVLPDAAAAGFAALLLILTIPMLVNDRLYMAWLGSSILTLVLIGYYVVSFALTARNMDAVSVLTQVTLSLSFLFVGLSYQNCGSLRQHRSIFYLASIVWFVLFFMMIAVGVYSKNAPKNIVGGVMMYLALIAGVEWLRIRAQPIAVYYSCVLLLLGGLVTGHRLSMGIGAAGLPLTFLMISTRSKFLCWLTVLIAVALSILTVFMYLNFSQISWFNEINSAVQDYSGRQILSGREKIWQGIINYVVSRDPVWGVGLNTTERDFLGDDFPASSSFIEIFLQTGAAGLVVMVMLLQRICSEGFRNSNSTSRAMLAFVMFVVVVHATYETILIQNNFRISALLWLTIGLAGAATKVEAVA